MKACPFCGADGERLVICVSEWTADVRYVQCCRCAARGPAKVIDVTAVDEGLRDDPANAPVIDAWDKRSWGRR